MGIDNWITGGAIDIPDEDIPECPEWCGVDGICDECQATLIDREVV